MTASIGRMFSVNNQGLSRVIPTESSSGGISIPAYRQAGIRLEDSLRMTKAGLCLYKFIYD